MSKTFSLDFEVRDYELDQYGVVNNAVYLNYLEHTRHAFLNAVGIDPAQVAREGRSLALAEITLRFRTPLRSRDRFRIDLSVVALSGARAVMAQRIARLPGGEPVLEARATAVFVAENGRPQRIAPDVRDALAPYVVSGDHA